MADYSEKKLVGNQSDGSLGKQKFSQDDSLTKANTEMNCYEGTLNCCGSFWGSLRAWCPCIFFCCPYPFVNVQQGSRALLQKFGRFQRILEPGFHEVNPCTEKVFPVSIKTVYTVQNITRVLDLNRQLILTKDNITVDIDTILYYRIVDPTKATYRVRDVVTAIKEITYATLRTICGEHVLQDMLENRQMIAEEIENSVFTTVSEWGVFVEQIFIKDMILSQDLQFSLKDGLIKGHFSQSYSSSKNKSDVEAAKLLREASDMLSSKAAMQIRYFETIQAIAKGVNPKVLFLGLSTKDAK